MAAKKLTPKQKNEQGRNSCNKKSPEIPLRHPFFEEQKYIRFKLRHF
jgi:hypothetical protein